MEVVNTHPAEIVNGGGASSVPPSILATGSAGGSTGLPSPEKHSSKPGIMGGVIRGSLRSRKRESTDGEVDANNRGKKEGTAGPDAEKAGETGGGKRARLEGGEKRGSTDSLRQSQQAQTKAPERWRSHRMVEDYVNLVGDIMYPKVGFGPYGYDISKGEVPLERPNTLGVLLCPARRRTVIERWNPFEIACFEGAITILGKNFYEISKLVKTKNTKEVIEFFYLWKMTSHYQQWKKSFEPLDPHPFSIAPPDDDEEEDEDEIDEADLSD